MYSASAACAVVGSVTTSLRYDTEPSDCKTVLSHPFHQLVRTVEEEVFATVGGGEAAG